MNNFEGQMEAQKKEQERKQYQLFLLKGSRRTEAICTHATADARSAGKM